MRADLEEVAGLLERRTSTAPDAETSASARRVLRHVEEFLIPRAGDLDAPVMAVILGSTGSGKSSLINALAGSPISEVGVLRPTTRVAMALSPPGQDLTAAVQQLRGEGALEVAEVASAWDGLVIVDAPDFDSVESANRELARRLLESADLLIFMTTDTRYADEVPWTILSRAAERGIPMLTVINRLPRDVGDRTAVIDDYRKMLERSDLVSIDSSTDMEVIGVGLGQVDPEMQALSDESVVGVREALDRLVEDDERRKDLVRRSLDAAIADLPRSIDSIARKMEEEAQARRELLSLVDDAYRRRSREVEKAIDRGSFLRAEILREWQEFVGANRVARFVADGVGKVAASLRAIFSPGPPAPAHEVREGAISDLNELIVAQLDGASSEASAEWSNRTHGATAIERHPELWGAGPGATESLAEALQEWAGAISTEILELGERRRGLAKAASLGVNVVGTGAILAVFANTGGLTGAEAGIAAATAVVNQALLEAIFGEANVAAFVGRARARLDTLVALAFSNDRSRFEDALHLSEETDTLARQLRAAVARLRT